MGGASWPGPVEVVWGRQVLGSLWSIFQLCWVVCWKIVSVDRILTFSFNTSNNETVLTGCSTTSNDLGCRRVREFRGNPVSYNNGLY